MELAYLWERERMLEEFLAWMDEWKLPTEKLTQTSILQLSHVSWDSRWQQWRGSEGLRILFQKTQRGQFYLIKRVALGSSLMVNLAFRVAESRALGSCTR